ncbi:molybdopterin-guanine dinucleotide biosynthesis protein A [Arthrobacter stackebrandtii]|uniref:Molybdopterin-guanine dinucleotide biosynthesis protein A n=1 Tax=Arthrobacter stackebrandtii TaxID=272161 RepID=A0ABS4YU15_9MICC|nr:NTP transferase domain-containing protein [Arthrobacter stackebrandtii]MBP2411897.1 molybdopterin-guanine dinucleotide biosynthesis protein A [Arthrobacter stackebrandtii]PYG99075.1 molybdopterin-guanine dinucleotide biosynthesis protein MobA [Arthrobacter stackebrandtii]
MSENSPRSLQAVVLAGGLSRRLGGVPKAGLVVDGQTLLARTVDAAAGVVRTGTAPSPGETTAEAGETAQAVVVVVGPGDRIPQWLAGAKHAGGVATVQEDPPFAGPAAGLAAGIGALAGESGHVLVLACDMPGAGDLARRLVAEWAACAPGEGIMAVAGGKRQPLAAIYPLPELRAAVAGARVAHRLENASVFSLIASVKMIECAVPTGLAADIDTWDDARAQGIAVAPPTAEGHQLENHDELLQAWTQKLLEAFEIADIEVDIHAVLNLAGVAAHSIVRPAAPLTTFVAGMAAGLAAGSGQVDEATAMKAALGLAKKLSAAEAPAPGSTGAAAAEAPAAE